jgi:hypothetical protein
VRGLRRATFDFHQIGGAARRDEASSIDHDPTRRPMETRQRQAPSGRIPTRCVLRWLRSESFAARTRNLPDRIRLAHEKTSACYTPRMRDAASLMAPRMRTYVMQRQRLPAIDALGLSRQLFSC